MLVHLDALVVAQLFCLVQGLTTAAYVLCARPRRAASIWLGLLVLALTAQVLDYFLGSSGVYFRHRSLYFAPLFFSWGFGPLLYAYVRTLLDPSARIRAVHFVPVAVQALFYLVMCLQPLDVKAAFWSEVHRPVTRYVEYYGAVVSVFVYLALASTHLRHAADGSPWVRRFLLAMAAVYVAVAIDPAINGWYAPAGAPRFFLATILLPPFVYLLALWGFRHGRSVERTTAGQPVTMRDPAAQRASAPPAEVARTVDATHVSLVRRAFESEQVFRDPDLTLDTLAAQVGLTPNAVSLAINAGLGQSFSDLVNGYRIADVQRRMQAHDASDATVLQLAFDAGFNSKTTFNRVFKERTGMTPREYRKTSHPTRRDDTRVAAH